MNIDTKRRYNNLNSKIGAALIQLLIEKGWSQKSLSNFLEINQSFISRMLREERTISYTLFLKLIGLIDKNDFNNFVILLKDKNEY